MANQKMLALVLALATSAKADNCNRAAPYISLKTGTLDNLHCPAADLTCDTTSCGCANECCETKPSSCEQIKTTACGTGRTYTGDSATRALAATAANFDTVCCVAKPTCSTHTCSAGMKMKAAASLPTTCTMHTCTDSECCEPDNTKCYGLAPTLQAGGCSSSCGSCAAAKVYDYENKHGVAATSATFSDNCCITTTTTTQANCGMHTCEAWEKTPSGVTTSTSCIGGVSTCAPTCCEDDTAKCKGAKTHLNTTTAQQCDSTTEFQDPTKHGVAVSAAADWKAACCTAKTTCTAFGAHSYSGQASGAEAMQKPVTGLLLLFTSLASAFGK